jgi:hypothetical protein
MKLRFLIILLENNKKWDEMHEVHCLEVAAYLIRLLILSGKYVTQTSEDLNAGGETDA